MQDRFVGHDLLSLARSLSISICHSHWLFFRKLESAVAVRNSCWKGFPANFDAAGQVFPDFRAAMNAIPPRFGHFPGHLLAMKMATGNWPRGPRLLDFLATASLSFCDLRKTEQQNPKRSSAQSTSTLGSFAFEIHTASIWP